MREWLVAGAVIETDEGLLLVRNLRRNGEYDWTPPGGVIETTERHDVREGLAREVLEETGLVVDAWGPMLYEVEAEAPDLGWVMRAQIFQVESVVGDLVVGNDPDGIVTDAAYVPLHRCGEHLEGTHDWVREPLTEWLDGRWGDRRTFRYRLEDASTPGRGRIVRL
ncbi:MAG: NUDIX hydrolase [Acidimicrobiales bacterium]